MRLPHGVVLLVHWLRIVVLGLHRAPFAGRHRLFSEWFISFGVVLWGCVLLPIVFVRFVIFVQLLSRRIILILNIFLPGGKVTIWGLLRLILGSGAVQSRLYPLLFLELDVQL